MPELQSVDEEEENSFKGVLHSAGDIVNIVASIPIEEVELRKKVLNVITFIVLEARNHIELAVEQTILNQALHSPLEKEFSNEQIYGINLVEDLISVLKNEKERTIAKEQLLDNEEEDPEEDNPDEIEEN